MAAKSLSSESPGTDWKHGLSVSCTWMQRSQAYPVKAWIPTETTHTIFLKILFTPSTYLPTNRSQFLNAFGHIFINVVRVYHSVDLEGNSVLRTPLPHLLEALHVILAGLVPTNQSICLLVKTVARNRHDIEEFAYKNKGGRGGRGWVAFGGKQGHALGISTSGGYSQKRRPTAWWSYIYHRALSENIRSLFLSYAQTHEK